MSDTSERREYRETGVAPMRWLLLTGNRSTVAFAMLLGVAGLFFAAGLLGLATVTTPNRMMWFLNGTVNGLLTLVPISVGVNQIVLSHEFGSVKDLPDELETKLDELVELFDEIDAARQYIKTVVVERQLARLSRMLVYTGIPAVAVAALGIFTYRNVPGLALSHAALVVLAGALVALTLAPLAILSAYILRVATIARRTAAFGPFVTDPDRRSDRH